MTPIRSILVALALCVGACDASTVAPTGEDPFPAATVNDCEGQPVDLRAYIAEHDVTYVTFGAKWCTACQKEAPIINSQVVDAFADQSVGAVQILIESDPGEAPPQALCGAWRDELGARFDIVVDVEQVTLEPFFGTGVSTLPLHLVVTRDGQIRHRNLGDIPANLTTLISDWL